MGIYSRDAPWPVRAGRRCGGAQRGQKVSARPASHHSAPSPGGLTALSSRLRRLRQAVSPTFALPSCSPWSTWRSLSWQRTAPSSPRAASTFAPRAASPTARRCRPRAALQRASRTSTRSGRTRSRSARTRRTRTPATSSAAATWSSSRGARAARARNWSASARTSASDGTATSRRCVSGCAARAA